MRKNLWSLIVLGLLVAFASGSQNATGVAHAAGAAPLLGFGVDGAFVENASAITLVKQASVRWIRTAIWWSSLEPNNRVPADYDWTVTDGAVNEMLAAGLKPVVYITHNPAWAGPISCGPIDTSDVSKLEEFAEFTGALAARYPKVPVWVLYNEVDYARDPDAASDGCFGNDITGDLNQNGIQDTVEYAVMLATARKAMRAANANAQVAISVAFDNFDTTTCPPKYPGGCPPGSTYNYYFLPNLLSYMAAHPLPSGEAYADLIGFDYWEPYGQYWESMVGKGYYGVQAKTQFLRQVMEHAGVSFNLYVSQTGINSNTPSVGLEGQSQCLVRTMVRGAAADLQGLSWWLLKDIPSYNWYYGLTDEDLNPKPAYTAYQTLARQLKRYTFDQTLSKKKVEAYQFVKGTQKQVVVWSSAVDTKAALPCADTHRTQTFKFSNVTKLRIRDLYHTTVTNIVDNGTGDYDARVGRMKIIIGDAPMYVQLYQ